MNNTANKHSRVERKQHLAKVAEMYCRGKRQYEIAQELSVTQQQISYDLKLLQRYWREAAITNINEAKLRELAKIDELEREYWDAWARSKSVLRSKRVKVKGEELETTRKREERVGDPRFLEGVQWCIEKRSSLLGLDKLEEEMGNAARALAAQVRDQMRSAEEATLGNADGRHDATMDKDS